MCRIAIGPSEMFTQEELSRFFEYLEKSNGGDGNGIWVNGKVHKDLKLTPKLAAAKAKKGGGPFVFHTRLRSVGSVENKALHPVKAGDGYLVQNGTFSAWRSYYDGKATTDTLAIAELVEEKGAGVLLSKQLQDAGVFVYIEGNEIKVFKRRKRPFVLHLFESGRWLYASEDVGWLVENDEDYTIITFGDEVKFSVDRDGMPRKFDLEAVHLSTKGYKYSTGNYRASSYGNYSGRYDEEWWDHWVNHKNKQKGGTIGSFEDGEFIAAHCLFVAQNGEDIEEYSAMVNEWLELSEIKGTKVSMCSVCNFPYEGCEEICPMYTGLLAFDEEKEEGGKVE